MDYCKKAAKNVQPPVDCKKTKYGEMKKDVNFWFVIANPKAWQKLKPKPGRLVL